MEDKSILAELSNVWLDSFKFQLNNKRSGRKMYPKMTVRIFDTVTL